MAILWLFGDFGTFWRFSWINRFPAKKCKIMVWHLGVAKVVKTTSYFWLVKNLHFFLVSQITGVCVMVTFQPILRAHTPGAAGPRPQASWRSKITVLRLVKNPYQNVTFFPRFTFYLIEKPRKKPGIGARGPARRPKQSFGPSFQARTAQWPGHGAGAPCQGPGLGLRSGMSLF